MAGKQLKVKAIRPQGEFLSLPQRFRSFVSGYGAGKTWVGCMSKCKKYLEQPGLNQGYFAPTYPQIRDIFYPTIEEVADQFGMNVDIKEGNREVHFYTGRQYRGTTICRSMERPHTIIGFKIAHALIDEMDVLPMDKATTAWRKILARMRYNDAANSIDVTTTPEGFMFVYNTFVKQVAAKPEMRKRYAIVQASTYDNEKNLPEDYIPSLIEAYPKELVSAYLHGQFVNMRSGTVYYAFDRKVHDSVENIREKEPLFIGMDFNVGKMAAVVYVKRPNGWHSVFELKDIFDTPAMIDTIRHKWKDKGHNITVYPDPTGKSRKSVDVSSSDIVLLKQAGFSVKTSFKSPFVRDRVLSVNKQFQSGNLWVNVNACPRLTECLEQQAYDVNGEPDKTSGLDHMNDAFGYPIVLEFPILKPTTTVTNISVN